MAKIDELREVTLTMKVRHIMTDESGSYLSGWVKINESEEKYVTGIPLVTTTPFDPVREQVENDFNEDEDADHRFREI